MTNRNKKWKNKTAFFAITLVITILLSAIHLVTPTVQAQQQGQGGNGGSGGNGSGDQDRNQTRTQDPSTHQNATSNYQQQQNQNQNQTQQQSPSAQGQHDRNQTRTRDPSTHNEIIQERWRNQTQTASDEIHRMHIGSNAETVEPYVANFNYTLTAEGTAVSFLDSSVIEDASATIQMSTWRSNERIVSMDIVEGTITIGDREETIQAGGVYYLPKIQLLKVYGLVEYEGDDGNTYVKLLRITSSLLSVENPLPTDDSEPSYTFESSTFSRLDAEYYLKMSGAVVIS